MAKRSMFVGMDVHKESIDISLAEEGRDGEVRHYGGITSDLEALAKVVTRCARRLVGCASCTKRARAGLPSTATSRRRWRTHTCVRHPSLRQTLK